MAGRIPACAYATVVLAGHPDRIVETLNRLESWIAEQGRDAARRGGERGRRLAAALRVYPTDPKVRAGPEHWDVEVAYLLEEEDRP